ncbi:asparagine--tRNA ligase [candidate division WOR-3 bacterium]|nr:asparagine--tRNA ligase [candidate division WOR-3 bacterium]
MSLFINHLSEHIGEEVEVRGWVYNKRSSGKISFLLLRDGTGIVQCIIFHPDANEEVIKVFETLTIESGVIVKGKIKEDKRSPIGVEIDIISIIKISDSDDYPITLKEHGPSFLLDNRHLWLRSKKQNAIMNIRSDVIFYARQFFQEREFLCIDAPIFTPAACEGTTTLFETKYYDDKVYLTQSGQLYMEAAALAYSKVYCFGPSFRAEKSKTRRHLTEFWQLEPEVAFMNLDEDMELAEDMIVYITENVLNKREQEFKDIERDIEPLKKIKKPFYRLTYTEAVDVLHENGFEDFKWGDDFGAPHETVISNKYDKPVFIHRYPSKIKAFYMKRDPKNDELALGFDMIAPEGYGETIGGGQREDDHDTLVKRIKEHNLPMEAFTWYLDLRKYGSVPHAGFGLGLERFVQWLTLRNHLRETIPFPRMMDRKMP